MKRNPWSLLAAMLLMPCAARAQGIDSTLDAMKKQMEQQQQEMQELRQKVKELEAVKTSTQGAIVQTPGTPAPPVTSSQHWTPSQPITLIRSGANYMNISFDTLVDVGWSTESDVTKLQLGDHDPNQRGFSLRNTEVAVDGAVDPYFKAFGNIVWKLDEHNESEVELEEAYVLSTALPWNLQVKAGQFFAEFGRQNPTHPHTWAFVDEPLIMGRLLGGDGLRNVGARLSWLPPTPFYSELLLGVFNGEGGTSFSFRNLDNTYGRTPVDRGLRGPQDLLFVPHITSSFDLSDTHTVVLGASGAFGTNDSGAKARTEIYGVDAYWKWRPINAQQGFPFISWQTEAMFRTYHAAADPSVSLPAETIEDYGFYSQVLWGFYLRWVAGLRGEYVTGTTSANDALDPLARGDRTRVSPNITFYPTEFSKLRLQYNYDHGQVFGDEHSVWMQIEFLLGAHGAHKF